MSSYLGTTPIADGASTALLATKADVDLSNCTASGKNTAISWGMPDWSAGTDIAVPLQSTPYVCPSDGVYVACFLHNGSDNTATYLYINGTKTANCLINSSGYKSNKSSISVVLGKGDSIYFDHGVSGSELYSSSFYPLKGAS